jgi:hypothetical protein
MKILMVFTSHDQLGACRAIFGSTSPSNGSCETYPQALALLHIIRSVSTSPFLDNLGMANDPSQRSVNTCAGGRLRCNPSLSWEWGALKVY